MKRTKRFLHSPPGLVAIASFMLIGGAALFTGLQYPGLAQDLFYSLTNLTDVTAKTGTGTTVVMDGSPTITTPTIASFANSAHDHADAAGGGNLAASAITSGTVSHERGGLEADVSAGDGFVQIKGGSTTVIKSNFTATTAPASTDDGPTNGYAVGSIWIDVSADTAYICSDSSDDAAVWEEIGAGGGGGGAPTDATYLTTSADGTLSAEVVISSLGAALTFKGDDAAGRTITFGQQVTNADSIAFDVPVANVTVDGSQVLTEASTTSALTTVGTLASPTLTSPTLNTGVSGTAVLDEDDLSTDSNTQLATQQSIKAYVDLRKQAVNIEDYGAVEGAASGAETTNDTAFANAITAAGTSKAVYVPAGTYEISVDIAVAANQVRIFGDGFRSKISQLTTSENGLSLATANTSLQLDNLTLAGPGSGTGIGILCQGSNVHFTNVRVESWGSHGIEFSDESQDLHLSHLDVRNNGGDGIKAVSDASSMNGFALSILQSLIYGNTGNGITYNGKGFTSVGNTIEANGGIGIEFDASTASGTKGAIVLGGFVESNAGGQIWFSSRNATDAISNVTIDSVYFLANDTGGATTAIGATSTGTAGIAGVNIRNCRFEISNDVVTKVDLDNYARFVYIITGEDDETDFVDLGDDWRIQMSRNNESITNNATAPGLWLRSADDSTTNPVLRVTDSADTDRFSAYADGTFSGTTFPSGRLAHEHGGLEADVSAGDGFVEIKGGATTVIKSNLTATVDPTANEDSGDGYAVGSVWVNVTGDKSFVCVDPTGAAAVWKETSAGAGGGISNVVEDTTPQLGGDLDLNGQNLDFPSTPNISDVLDEDNMASDSATALATQQSIKAYADTKAAASHTHAAGDVTSGTLAHERGGLEADLSAYGGLALVQGGSTSELKLNLNASVAPAATDDGPTMGYAVGSIWIDTTADTAFQCVDASAGAAVWKDIGAAGGSGAPTDATYLTNSSNGTLSAEVVIGSLGSNLTFKGDDAAGRTITLGQQVTNADTITIDVPLANVTVDGQNLVDDTRTITVTGDSGEITVAEGAQDLSANRTFTVGVADDPVFPGTGATTVTVGTTAQEPAAGDGKVRYDSDTERLMVSQNGNWREVTEYINVLDYGVVSGGAAGDNDTGFAAAIAAITATRRTIFVPGGDYDISADITISGADHVTFMGEGNGTQITQTGTDAGDDGIVITGSDYCTVRDLRLIGNASSGDGITVVATSPWTRIENVFLEGHGVYGIQVASSDGVSIRDCVIRTSGEDGIQIGSGGTVVDGVSVTNCLIQSSGDDGIVVMGHGTTITGNVIESNTGVGIYVDGPSAPSLVEGVSLTNNTLSENLAGQILITGKTSTTDSVDGVYITGGYIGSTYTGAGSGTALIEATSATGDSSTIRDVVVEDVHFEPVAGDVTHIVDFNDKVKFARIRWRNQDDDATDFTQLGDSYVIEHTATAQSTSDTATGPVLWAKSADDSTTHPIFKTSGSDDVEDFAIEADGTITGSSISGSDGTLISGTAGTDQNLIEWDANGDAIDSGIGAANVATLSGSQTVSGAKTFSAAPLFSDGVTVTFNPDGTSSGLNVGSQAGDPSTPGNGDIWYDSTANTLDARINGATVSLGAGSADKLGLTITATKTANYTAAAGELVAADASGGSFAVTLPASPSAGDVLGIVSWTDQGAYEITIDRNGNQIDSGTDESPFTLLRLGDSVVFQYADVSGGNPGWIPIIRNYTGDLQTGISAAGTTQGAGTVITGSIAEVTSVTASSAEAVTLKPITVVGQSITVLNNDSADTLKLFPGSGDAIQGGSANASYDIPAGEGRTFIAIDTTNWYQQVTPAAGSGADTALSNLASVAINLSLTSDTDVTDDLGTGDIRWDQAFVQSVDSGNTAADTLKLRGRDVDGAAYVDILTITSNNTVTADLDTSVTIGGNAILDDTSTTSALTTVGTLVTGNADAIVSAASDTTAGKIEIATGAETNTGTDATRAVSPDGLDDWTGSAQITTVGTLASPTLTTPTINGSTITGVNDAGGATSFEIPNGDTPTVNADGEIAVDNTVTDFTTGLLRFYGSGEEQAVVAMPVAEFTSPTDGHVVAYNATNDEFELVAAGSADNLGNHTATETVHFGTVVTNTISANAATIDLGNDNHQIVDLEAATGTVTLTLTAPDGTASGIILILQDGTAARDITWADGTGVGIGVWLGTEPTWTDLTTDDYQAVSWYFNGTDVFLTASSAETASFGTP